LHRDGVSFGTIKGNWFDKISQKIAMREDLTD